ncbi:MAG: hypothetical protein KDD37_10175 [Bdellovibrionales bacterium]|nr:hypothetical protein [Bdellovibrionales bacterium]
MMLIYRYIFFPIFYLLTYTFRFAHPKLRAYFKLRKNPYKDIVIPKNAYWFHCSSGEIEYAKPIFRWLKETHPSEKIVVTYFSNSSLNSIKKIAEIDIAVPLPIDTKGKMRDFINLFQPKYLFVARTDLWPEMLYQAHAAKIPCVLFAATLSDTNIKYTNPLARYLFQQLLSKLSLIICVSVDDASRFRSFQIKKLEVATDTRYLQVVHRLQHKKALPCQIKPTKPIIIFGSTWSKDEEKLLPAFLDLLTEGFQIILVPHEVTKKHLSDLYEEMDYQCLTYAKWSKTSVWDNSEILVVDQVGYLAELYSYAEVAFIGGSFKRQVHSVMEALASGCLTLVGPKYKNNREAIEFQEYWIDGIQPVQVIQDKKHLLARVRKWKKEQNRKKFKASLISKVENLAHDAEKTFTHIERLIQSTDA